MKNLLLSIVFVVLSTSAFADLTIVQKVVSAPVMGQPGKNGTMTQYYKGTKSRINTDQNTYMIIDVKEGKMFTVDTSKKQVMVMPREMLNKTAEMGMMMIGGGKFSVNKTGKSDTVNGYKCEEYSITGKSLNITSCTTTDVDLKELEPFRAFGQDIIGKALSEVPGLSVRSQFKMSLMGQEITGNSEVVSISKDPVPDSMFVIPPDYQVKEMNLPALQH
jgi:Domain of unknown function (DUF4412)